MVLKIRLIQTIVCALITGFVYFGTPINSDTIMSINGILFNHVRNINFMLQFPAVPVITMELPIVLRENANGIYTTTSYFLGKNIAELPQYIILPAIYNVIVYWMAGLVPNIWTFLFATLICALMTNVAISICTVTKLLRSTSGRWSTSFQVIAGCLNHTLKISNCPKSGAEVLEQIDFDGFSKWADVLILTGMFVIIRVVAYVALLIRAYRSQ
ncbi:ABC-2 type transporter [Ancylostoma caninum]|uniref:ABC-2 type transporter n=1 Tax=Ancylostoma caninum TaxID=29170 RepID=A0A368FG67_ANCCA|nr:ABC-2 type transporter [Ancylostoma caninum]